MAIVGTPFIERAHASSVMAAGICGRVARRVSDCGWTATGLSTSSNSGNARTFAILASESLAYWSTSKDGGTVGRSLLTIITQYTVLEGGALPGHRTHNVSVSARWADPRLPTRGGPPRGTRRASRL